MADSILKIRTQDGDKPIGYPGLADKPVSNKELDTEGAFADAKVVGDKFKEVKVETDSDGIIDIMAKNSKDEWIAILRLQDGELLRKKDLAKQGFSGLKLDFKGRLRLVTSY